ncbi:hypothetical protein [Devosia sp.]|uniref:hypothetical protein n=1 Tax=Devosia sp. TaxID=1871048 RepID=UPI003266279E
MRIWAWLAGAAVFLVLASGAAAAAIPGPQRALCPQCFGLIAIGDDAFTDDPAQADHFRQLMATADSAIAEFYGSLQSHPRYVLCTRPQCLATFGGGSTGITYGWQLIRIAPQGLRPAILTHERLHAELAARLGWRGLWSEPVPVWFNEGLATYLAHDDRFNQPYTAADIAWIKHAVDRVAWNQLLAERDWIAGYGAAAAAVAELNHHIGRNGLRDLLDMVAGGETFDAALKDLLPT